jgi:hypothetical protein
MDDSRRRGFIPWSKIENWLNAFRSIWLSTNPPQADLYRVDVRRLMEWEYGSVANRTDWIFEQKAP